MSFLRRLDAGRLGLLAVLVIGGLAFLTRDQWDWLLQDGSVRSEGVTAPTIDDVDEVERLYRAGAGSSVTYRVEERLAGTTKTATGTTHAVAGDIAVNIEDPSASRVGVIVVNVEMFESDSSLRDRRIRHDYLESRHHPYAEFETTAVTGVPAAFTDGETVAITLDGLLTVKETTAPATLQGTVTVTAEELRATMSTTVSMSAFDVGPINIAGLVHTGDDVELTIELVAPRVAADSVAGNAPEFAGDDFTPTGGEFAATVMPILESSCAGCHGTGGPGSTTVLLDTAADAAAIAADLALITEARYMPPWPAGPQSVPFLHDRSLTDDEIAVIGAWAAAGGGLDVAPDTPLVAAADSPVISIEGDLETALEPYAGDPLGKDDYRCQVVEVGDPATERWIKAFDFEADQTEVVHHVLFSLATESQRETAAALSAQDEKPGFDCIGPTGAAGPQFWAWAPGAPPAQLPAGAAIRLAPGDFIVVQIHFHYDHEAPLDASRVIVDLYDDDELASGPPLVVAHQAYQTAAEVPCTDDQEGPLCDRDAVIAEFLDLYGPFGATIPNALLGRCGHSLDDYLADTDGVTTSTCSLPVTNPGRLLSLWPHMHEFGSSFRMTLNPGTDDEMVLVDVPTWAFEWQLDYQPADEIVIRPGDRIELECTWDRSLAHQEEPRYITFGLGTGDEMCYATLATLPLE